MRKLKAFIRTHWIDLVLGFSGAILLGVFSYQALNTSRYSGLDDPIATLLEGEAERKSVGRFEYRPAKKGDVFYDLDSVWVGKDRTARFRLADGTEIKLKPLTYVRFRRPFRSGSYRLEEQ